MQAKLRGEAKQLSQQAIQQYRDRQFEAALKSFQQLLAIYQEIGDRTEEGRTLDDIGSTYKCLSQYSQALGFYQQALEIAQEIGDHNGEGTTLTNIGFVYKTLNQNADSLNCLQQASKIFNFLDDSNNEKITLTQSSLICERTGNYPKALELLNLALVVDRKLDDFNGESETLITIGQIYKMQGQYPQALKFLQEGLELSKKSGSQISEGVALNNLAGVYEELGQYLKALELYKKALAIFREIDIRETDSRHYEGDTLNNIGVIYGYMEQHSQGIEFYQQALSLREEIDDHRGQGDCFHNIGSAHKDLTQYSKALEFFDRALTLRKEIGDRAGEGSTLNGIAEVYQELEQYYKALEFYQQALTIAREIGNQKEVGHVLYNMGTTFILSGKFVEGEKTLIDAMTTLESVRIGLEDTDKVSVFDVFSGIYRLLQQVLVENNKVAKALEISERGRARAFIELIAMRLSTQLEEIPSIPYPTCEDILQISQILNSTLIEYSIVNSKTLFIWVVKPTSEAHLIISKPEILQQQKNISISDLVIQARQALGVENKLPNVVSIAALEASIPFEGIYQPLRQLHECLIQPIVNFLPTDPDELIIFIPHETLFLIPFPALQDVAGKFLIEQHNILTAPSIQIVNLMHHQQQELIARSFASLQPQDIIVVGNPTMPSIALKIGDPSQQLAALPSSGAEASMIAASLNTEAILGSRATKETIVQQMPKARLIHLATHGLLDDIRQLGVPGAIALSPSGEDNGFLTAGEILELRLSAELVILSACVTGLGKITGDGVIGLSRCLMAAGVPRVVVSLWSVSDLSTAFLMVKFHENLKNVSQLKPGDVANSLNQAQKWLLSLTSNDAKKELSKLEPHIYRAFAGRSKRVVQAYINRCLQEISERAPQPFANPVYWSAFVTIGL